jgi:hypothetical protein
MTLDEFRDLMRSSRQDAEEYAASLKDTYLALERLRAWYKKLSTQERVLADQVLAEWVLSEDENIRFDALALIDEYKIVGATPALQKLSCRLASSNAPGALHELNKIRRIQSGSPGHQHDTPSR